MSSVKCDGNDFHILLIRSRSIAVQTMTSLTGVNVIQVSFTTLISLMFIKKRC